MATFLIALFSVVLVLVCLFVTLLVLMQKPSANSGMGAALGGGAAEQAFGGEATNVLTRGTIYAIIAFFILSFGLYLGTLSASQPREAASEGASIGKLTETETVEPATDPEANAAAATEGEDQAEAVNQTAPESPSAIVEEVKGSAEGAAENAESSAVEPGKGPLQLENLDGSTAGSGS